MLNIFLYNNKVPLIERHHPTETTHSNIILIGVDSLGPKSISTKNTPALTHFIKDSVLFKETISPLARTYPAWSSILTGLYPHHHHARYNLMPPELVQSSSSVAWPLQHLGYQTIFATDDRQFNNMGKEFGFQTIIGSKLGVYDMLLGTFNDFPLSNFLVNLPFSHWIFPYNYINRASHFTYSPQSFDKALQYTLASRKQASPLFLAVHFTLPHWPYAWAESPPPKSHEYSPKERAELYLAALNRVDQQVAKLLRELHQYGYLENSLVVLLSDHGEAFYVSGSRQTNQRSYQGPGVSKFSNYLKQKTSTTLERSVGHGSDLLSAAQYHCILAFKIYRQNQLITTPKVINTRVALLDIAPTIYAFLNKPARQQVDGISLLKPLISDENLLHERFFIMESGMLPNQFLSREKAKVLGKKYFTVDAQTSQLQLRKKELAALDAMKLYAVIEGNWILALYPDGDDYMPIIMNLYSGKWTDELTSDFARLSPATNLLNHLQLFYKKKWPLIGDVPLKG